MVEVSLAPLNSEAVRRDPYAFYAELHKLGPICTVEPGTSRYDFVIHGFDACTQALRDDALELVDGTQTKTRATWESNRASSVFMNSMFFTNGARHARMRAMFNRTFTPRRISALEPAVEQLTSVQLDHLETFKGEKLDFMSEYAFPVPANVLGELMGVPASHRAWYRPRAMALGKLLELGGSTRDNLRAGDKAAIELTDFFEDLCAQRRVEPQDDLVTALVQALEVDGGQLSREELLSNLVVVFNAGFVTTTHLLGNGVTLLLDNPAALQALRADPSLAPSYVEEILRCEVPTHFGVRWVASDTEVAGVCIPQGSRVLILMAAANRDPAKYPDPDRFDPSRSDSPSLAFSTGVHYCLGAALARMEGVQGLNMLLERFESIELAEPPGIPSQLMLRGHDELWLRLR